MASIESIIGANSLSKKPVDYKLLVMALLECLRVPPANDCPAPFTYESSATGTDLAAVQTEKELKLVVCDRNAYCVIQALRYCLKRGYKATIAWIDENDVVQCFVAESEVDTRCADFLVFKGCAEICTSSKVKKVTVYCECEQPEEEPPVTPTDTNNYIDTGCVFIEPVEFCDEKAWFCTQDPGSIYRFDPAQCDYIKVDKTMGINLGKPTNPNAKDCETVDLPFECVNDTDDPQKTTYAELVQKALDGAVQNGITWPNGDPITADAADLQFEYRAVVCVACEGTPVKLDDGSTFVVECDAGSVCVNPNGGTNGQSYSCGSEIDLGGGPADVGDQIGESDCITVLPGGAATGEISVARCRDKRGNLVDCTTERVDPVVPDRPEITIEKTADASAVGNPAAVGDVITYSFTVSNTGNVPLSGVTVTDPLVTVSGGPVDLAVGQIDTATFTATYALTQDDIDAEIVSNQATASGTAPDGTVATDVSDDPTTTQPNDPTDVPLVSGTTEQPAISLVKEITSTGPYAVGDTISGTYTVGNVGDVDLSNVTVTDSNAVVSGGPLVALAVGATDSSTFTWTHTVTAAEMAAGQHVNQGTATGTSPQGVDVTDLSGTTSVPDGDDPVVVPLSDSICPCGVDPTIGDVDFVTALDQDGGVNQGTYTGGSLTTTGLTEFVGTAALAPNNVHGNSQAGVRFGTATGLADENNDGSLDAPNVTLRNYQVMSYTFDQLVFLQDEVTLKDLDRDATGSDRFSDAAALWYEDVNGNIIPATPTTVGSDLITFPVSVGSQPGSVTLPPATGTAPNSSQGASGDTNADHFVSYDLSGVGVRRLIVGYWNNDNGATSGSQGISFESPLTGQVCDCPLP